MWVQIAQTNVGGECPIASLVSRVLEYLLVLNFGIEDRFLDFRILNSCVVGLIFGIWVVDSLDRRSSSRYVGDVFSEVPYRLLLHGTNGPVPTITQLTHPAIFLFA
jgi:hypothetical protein